MNNEISTEDVKALLKFIVAGYFFDVISKDAEDTSNTSPIHFNIDNKDKELLKMIANGLSNEDIARKLSKTSKDIQFQIDEIFSKLENKERTKDADFALKNQIFAL